MGQHDVPANLDYITKVTGQAKVTYVGHSQGTSQMYYALATNENYIASKVNLFVALGPVMKLTHCKSPLINLVMVSETLIFDVCDTLGIWEFFPANWVITGAMQAICGNVI
jgi:lysosomal acid lipase/cholesteryl ester hydrolase